MIYLKESSLNHQQTALVVTSKKEVKQNKITVKRHGRQQ